MASRPPSRTGPASGSAPPGAPDAAEERIRTELCALHGELVRWGLVAWTSGNVSARIPGTDRFAIKPSGLRYEHLTPESMVVCTLDGAPVDAGRSPSSDTAAHAYVYRAMPEVGGVAHTHSGHATAWAARGEPIPCAVTEIADEFGGDIPVGPFARIGDDAIGRGIVATLRGHRSRAVLMRAHGVFTIGPDPEAAVKAAVLCEDAARTVHLARQHGPVAPLPADDIDALHDRYRTVYGQPGAEDRRGGEDGA
ncbi:L-ribulose-5-phosphate 4-epimerase [Nocardiopsis coralliicola]